VPWVRHAAAAAVPAGAAPAVAAAAAAAAATVGDSIAQTTESPTLPLLHCSTLLQAKTSRRENLCHGTPNEFIPPAFH
jgi:hypothetical protein